MSRSFCKSISVISIAGGHASRWSITNNACARAAMSGAESGDRHVFAPLRLRQSRFLLFSAISLQGVSTWDVPRDAPLLVAALLLWHNGCMDRIPEPELMDLPHEALAYAEADFADVNEAFVERLLVLAGPLGRANALDLGTGPCDIPLRLWRRRDWRIAAVDAASAMLRIGMRTLRASHCLGAIQPILSDAKILPFAAGSFDVIFSNSILHHLGEPERLWGEVARVGKRGALVFLRDLARPASQDAARRIVEEHAGSESALLQEEFYRSLLAAYTPEEIRRQLDTAGLCGLEVAMVTDRHLDVWGQL